MPRYYCDYCDTYLTHDSPSVRKQHNAGYKHKTNVRAYYTQFADQQTQSFIDERVKAYVGQTAAVLQQVGGAFPFSNIPTSSYKPPLLPPPTLPIPGSTSSGTTASSGMSATQGISTIRPPVLQPPRQPASSAAPPLLRPPTSSMGTAGLVGPPPTANGPLSISQSQNSSSSNLQGLYRMTPPQLSSPAQSMQQPQSLGSQQSSQQQQHQQTLSQDLTPSQQRSSTLLPGSLQSSAGNGYAGGLSQSQRVGVGPIAATQAAAAGSTYGGGGGGGIGTGAGTSGAYGSYTMPPSIRSSMPGASLSSGGGGPSLGPSTIGPLGPPVSSQPSSVYSYNSAAVGMGRSMSNPGGAVPTMNGSAESPSGPASSRVPGGGVPIGPSPYMGSYGVSVAGGYRTGMS